jgi:hypothetical protein
MPVPDCRLAMAGMMNEARDSSLAGSISSGRIPYRSNSSEPSFSRVNSASLTLLAPTSRERIRFFDITGPGNQGFRVAGRRVGCSSGLTKM